jgi:hypothetical protein
VKLVKARPVRRGQASYRYAGMMGANGYQSQLAVSRSGDLAVASVSDGSFIYINNTRGGTTWTTVWASSDGGAGTRGRCGG